MVRGRVQGEGFGEGGARFGPGVELVGFPDEDAREPQREFARDELARVLAEDEEEARLALSGTDASVIVATRTDPTPWEAEAEAEAEASGGRDSETRSQRTSAGCASAKRANSAKISSDVW